MCSITHVSELDAVLCKNGRLENCQMSRLLPSGNLQESMRQFASIYLNLVSKSYNHRTGNMHEQASIASISKSMEALH